MPGIIGRLLHEFAITISVAVLISGVISLTSDAHALQPFLRHEEVEPPRQSFTDGLRFRSSA